MSAIVPQAIQDVHTRISDVVDKGYVVDMHGKHIDIYNTIDHGLNYLGNLIQGNADSVNPMYYGQLERLYKKVLSMGPIQITKHTTVPTALELFSTTLRDPMFYGIQKNIATHWMRCDLNLRFCTVQLIYLEIIYLTDIYSPT